MHAHVCVVRVCVYVYACGSGVCTCVINMATMCVHRCGTRPACHKAQSAQRVRARAMETAAVAIAPGAGSALAGQRPPVRRPRRGPRCGGRQAASAGSWRPGPLPWAETAFRSTKSTEDTLLSGSLLGNLTECAERVAAQGASTGRATDAPPLRAGPLLLVTPKGLAAPRRAEQVTLSSARRGEQVTMSSARRQEQVTASSALRARGLGARCGLAAPQRRAARSAGQAPREEAGRPQEAAAPREPAAAAIRCSRRRRASRATICDVLTADGCPPQASLVTLSTRRRWRTGARVKAESRRSLVTSGTGRTS